jgi:predicted helicase
LTYRALRSNFRVEKMRFGKGASAEEKDNPVTRYNDGTTVRCIPLETYDYVVNGQSAIECVMAKQTGTTDAACGIVKETLAVPAIATTAGSLPSAWRP